MVITRGNQRAQTLCESFAIEKEKTQNNQKPESRSGERIAHDPHKAREIIQSGNAKETAGGTQKALNRHHSAMV